MLNTSGIKHKLGYNPPEASESPDGKRMKGSKLECKDASAESRTEVKGIGKASEPIFGYDISHVDIFSLSEIDTSLDRKSCWEALERGDEIVSRGAFERMVMYDDVDGVRNALKHPMTLSSSFQTAKDVALVHSVKDLNERMTKILLSSGASPSNDAIHEDAQQALKNPAFREYFPEKLEAIENVIHDSGHRRETDKNG